MRRAAAAAIAVVAASIGGCTSPQEYKEQADRQVYSILQAANEAVTGVVAPAAGR